MNLDAERRLAAFTVSGHLTVKGMFTRDAIRYVRESALRLFEAPPEAFGPTADFGGNARGLSRIFNAQDHSSALEGLLHARKLVETARFLLGCQSIRLWYSQLIYKYPIAGQLGPSAGQIGWHTDYAYWKGLQPASLLTCWVPMQDTSPETGGIVFRPLGESEDPELVKGFNKDFADIALTNNPTDAPRFSRGDASFHHCLTPHASSQNTEDQPRLAFAIHLMDASIRRVDTSRLHHSLDFLDLSGSNPLENGTFPILTVHES